MITNKMQVWQSAHFEQEQKVSLTENLRGQALIKYNRKQDEQEFKSNHEILKSNEYKLTLEKHKNTNL